MSRLKELWLKIPAVWRVEAVSVAQTFFAVLLAELAVGVNSGDWSRDALVALVCAAFRAAVKAVLVNLSAWLQARKRS